MNAGGISEEGRELAKQNREELKNKKKATTQGTSIFWR